MPSVPVSTKRTLLSDARYPTFNLFLSPGSPATFPIEMIGFPWQPATFASAGGGEGTTAAAQAATVAVRHQASRRLSNYRDAARPAPA